MEYSDYQVAYVSVTNGFQFSVFMENRFDESQDMVLYGNFELISHPEGIKIELYDLIRLSDGADFLPILSNLEIHQIKTDILFRAIDAGLDSDLDDQRYEYNYQDRE